MPVLQSSIGTAVVDTPGIVFKLPQIQLRKLVVEPFCSSGFQTADTSQRSPVLVIIDGLDKCKCETEQLDILRSIADAISSHHLPLRFLIASHPEPHIRCSFDNLNLPNACFRICLDKSFHPVNDIQIFLRDSFNAIYEKHLDTMASIPRPWPSPSVILDLSQRSSGQFIYPATVLRFIDDEDCRPSDQLELVLALQPTALKDLDLLYSQILSTCTNPALLTRILGCILVAMERLSDGMTAVFIETLLCLREGDVRLTLRRLHSLLNVPDSPDSRIFPYHASLGDFIFNPDCSGKYHISQHACHLDMARSCLYFAKHHLDESAKHHLEECVCAVVIIPCF
jgi:hypothetical protein